MVEVQTASTMKLTDTLEEQAVLERVIAETEPKVPEECRHLGELLLAPFRYSPYPFNSRFRRAGSPDGVFYASEASETAVAETAFHRLLFFAESPGIPWPDYLGEFTCFASEIATAKAVDLTRMPLVRDRALWTELIDYTACLELAETVRAAGLEAIRYESVRDPQTRANVALLSCRAFAAGDTVDWQSWRLYLQASGIRALCASPARRLAFDLTAFAADPRIADWCRER